VGLIAGYRRGWLDQVVMRLVDLQMAFPAMLLAIFLLYLVGSSVTNLVVLLTIFSWAGFARVARAETLRVRNLPFVEGAVAVGARTDRILWRHILPHLVPVLSVLAVFDFAGVMLAESSLSFLGLGIQPPGSSWGLMLADSREHVYTGGWWLFLIPGAALFITTLSASLSSRWLQELTHARD
jgi:peptide/nickel transport system permease protein